MRLYTQQHQHYCGIDLHARSLYLCILNQAGEALLHRNLRATPDAFFKAITPYRQDLVVAVECMFTWYWLADLCQAEGIACVLGHALYMKAIHGGKAKHDRIDAHKIAVLLRGGMLPETYVYPPAMRATRDLLRRRLHFTRKRAELLTHIENTNSQYNLPAFTKKLTYRGNRTGVVDRFVEASVQKTIAVDLELIACYDDLLRDLEAFILRTAKGHDANTLYRLRTVPGIGKILSLVILYEIHDIRRFARPQELASYARLVKCAKGVCRQDQRERGHQDRQRALEVGLLRDRGGLPAEEPHGPGVLRAAGPETRQGEGADGAGPQARTRRLPHLEARPGVRPGEVSGELREGTEGGGRARRLTRPQRSSPPRTIHLVHGMRPGTAALDWTPVSAPRQRNGSEDVLPLTRAWH